MNKLLILLSVIIHREPEKTPYSEGAPKYVTEKKTHYCAGYPNFPKHNYLSYLFSVVNSMSLNVSHIVSRVNSCFRFVTIVVNRLATRIINILKQINNTFTKSNKKLNICIYNYMHKLSKKQGVYA